MHDRHPQYLRTPEAARFLCLSHRTLERLRVTGEGPPFFRPEGRRFVLYRVSDLEAWLNEGRRQSTSDRSAR